MVIYFIFGHLLYTIPSQVHPDFPVAMLQTLRYVSFIQLININAYCVRVTLKRQIYRAFVRNLN